MMKAPLFFATCRLETGSQQLSCPSKGLRLNKAALLSALLLLPAAGRAATVTWDGGGGDNNWTTGANWVGDVAPSNPPVPVADNTAPPGALPDLVEFGGSTRTNPVLGVDNWFVDRITFLTGASSFTLGNAADRKTISIRVTSEAGHDSINFLTNNSANLQTINDNIALYGSGAVGNNTGGGIVANGDLTLNGTLSAPFSVSSMRFKPAAGKTLTLNGVMSGAWSQVASNGSGTTVLNAVNTYTGATAAWNGTLVAGVDALATGTSGAFGNSNGGAISMGNTANGAAYTAGIMTGGAVTIGRDITMVSNAANTNTYTIGGNSAQTSFYTGNIAMSTLHFLTVTSVAGGKVNIDRITQTSTVTTQLDDVTKTGAGIVALTGTSNYSGDTNVNVGTFLVNGILSATSTATNGVVGDVFVASTAALGGSGFINRDVILAAGTTLTPGDMTAAGVSSAGLLSITGDVSLGGNTNILNFDLGTLSDRVAITGNLTLDGTLNIANSGGFGAGTYELFSYTGTLTNNILTIGTTPNAGLGYSIDTSIANSVRLVVTPEPGRALLLMLGACALVFRRRRA